MKTYAMSDNDIKFFTKRSVARNILKGMSIEEAFKSVNILFEYFKYIIRDLEPVDVPVDEEAKLNEAMKQISDDQIDKFIEKNNKMNPNKNKKIGSIMSYVFLVVNLVPFECKIYMIYDGTGNGELLGTIKPSPIDDRDLVFSDADRDPLFHIRPKVDPPTISHHHGTTRVIAFMKDVAANFIRLVQHRECIIAARKVKNVPGLVEGCHVYTAHPLTAYITYHKPEKEEQKKMKLCGCKESCFERGECWGHLEGVMCKHLTEKEDGSDNGLITFCKKFNTPVETYDTKGQYDQLINDRQKTKDILTQLADKLTRNTSCNDIYNIMEYFQNIDVHDENFNQCCVMFRHAVNIALKLDTDLNVILGVSTLRLATDIEIDGSASSRMCNGIIIAKDYNHERSLCEKCPLKKCTTPCDGNIFADKFGYIIRKCNQYNEKTSKINALLKCLNDINIPHAYHPDSKLTNLFTNGYIEIIFPEPNTIKNVYAILDQFRPFFYFREAITNNGSINIWIYETRKSYEDHVHFILNNCKHNKEAEKEKKNAEE